MKDFRSRIVERAPTRLEVENLLEKGDLAKALRTAKRAKIKVTQDEIDAAAKKAYSGGRSGALLAMVDVAKYDIRLPFEKRELLVRSFESRDYHTFLKQAHRLRVREGIETHIEEAIAAIYQRRPEEAASWRKKFPRRPREP